ncbi:MAG: cyclodeaminase/cyclohydrolase family protein [Eubacteriales bacterium]|nr:cyclodeaminase/cyclohydrolase family protein [Eubacteriales bacterium]
MKYKDMSIDKFAVKLASNSPVPGGGGASALIGGIGIALGNMVGSLTAGKKKHAGVEEDIVALNARAKILYERFLELMDEDAKVFYPLYETYGMPTDTADDVTKKEYAMENALKAAAEVPLEVMSLCTEGIRLQREYEQKGSAIAISDVGTGVAALKAALLGASLNVFINTKSMKDAVYAQKLNERAQAMIEKYSVMADDIFADVRSRWD